MADCERLSKCPFFNQILSCLPTTAKQLIEKYCRSDKFSCARYQVASKGITPPPDLYPNEHDRLPGILREDRR